MVGGPSPGSERRIFALDGSPGSPHSRHDRFLRLGLSARLQAVADTGYTVATPIQAQAIPVALAAAIVAGHRPDRTGKTAPSPWPMIDRLVAGRSKAGCPLAGMEADPRTGQSGGPGFEPLFQGQKLSWPC